jgi:protein HIRA/HIR1
MKILKPNWVNHDGKQLVFDVLRKGGGVNSLKTQGKPIYSIDIHPDGSRFATGGQGDDCGKIIIWNMGPILDKEKEHDENIPKVLSQMDHHIGKFRKKKQTNKQKTNLLWFD